MIELIVAIGLFGIIFVFVTGAFMNIMSVKTQAEAKQQIMNDFRVALDLIGKEIMTAHGFAASEEGSGELFFSTEVRTDMDTRVMMYTLREGRIVKAQDDTQNHCYVQTGFYEGEPFGFFRDECFIPFSSEQVYVEDLTFYVQNFGEEGHGQPIVIVAVSGRANVSGVDPFFQTSMSYSPRATLNPEVRPPTDTRRPEIDIDKVTVSVDESEHEIEPTMTGPAFYRIDLPEGTGNSVDIEGVAWDSGGSGIRSVEFFNETTNNSGLLEDGFEPGTSDEQDWRFDGVLIATGMVNTIRFRAYDLATPTNSSHPVFLELHSQDPPEPPLAPTIEVTPECIPNSTDVMHRVSVFGEEDFLRPYTHYLIERDDGESFLIEKDVDFYNDYDVIAGTRYEYFAYAVNYWGVDDTEIRSDSSEGAVVDLDAEHCFPGFTDFTVDLGCHTNEPTPIVTLRVQTSQRAVINILNSADEVIASDTNPSTSFFEVSFDLESPVEYVFRAQACLGEDCRTSDSRSVSIDGDTCTPAEAWIHSLPDDPLDYIRCVMHEGEPALAVDLTLQFQPDSANLRVFSEFLIYECGNPPCSDGQLLFPIGARSGYRCGDDLNHLHVNCIRMFYPREEETYRYKTSSFYHPYNDPPGDEPIPGDIDHQSLGPLSGITEVYVRDICDGEEWDEDDPGSGGASIGIDLSCVYEDSAFDSGTAEENNFRIVRISISDESHPNPYSIYKVDHCVGASCTGLGECTWLNRDNCATHEGPEEGAHVYQVRRCNESGNDCSYPLSDSLMVSEGYCIPQTPGIVSAWANVSTSCHHHTAVERNASLGARADDRGQINIYRLIDGNLHEVVSGFNQDSNYSLPLQIGESYTFVFEACNYDLPSGEECGPTAERSVVIPPDPCPPRQPSLISLSRVCNDMGLIEEVVAGANPGSSPHYSEGLEIWRGDVNSPDFRCEYEIGAYSLSECTDDLGGNPVAIDDPVTYTYRARAYREPALWDPPGSRVYSTWQSRLIDLDSADFCDAPFELTRSRQNIYARVSGGSSPITTSDYVARIGVSPTSPGFDEAVTITREDIVVSLLYPGSGTPGAFARAGYSVDDITLNFVETFIVEPDYSDRSPFIVGFQDSQALLNQLDPTSDTYGATFTFFGKADSGRVAEIEVVLYLQRATGYTD